jgi:hypothetical protein
MVASRPNLSAVEGQERDLPEFGREITVDAASYSAGGKGDDAPPRPNFLQGTNVGGRKLLVIVEQCSVKVKGKEFVSHD